MTGRQAEPPAFRPRRRRYSLPPPRPVAVIVFLFCLIGWVSVGQADDAVRGDVGKAVEIRIPLYGGTHYRPRDLARQYRDRFDTPLEIDDVSDEPRRLTAGEWAAVRYPPKNADRPAHPRDGVAHPGHQADSGGVRTTGRSGAHVRPPAPVQCGRRASCQSTQACLAVSQQGLRGRSPSCTLTGWSGLTHVAEGGP